MQITHAILVCGTLITSSAMNSEAFAMGPVGGGENNESFKLISNDREFGDKFGFAVALSGNIVVVGAPQADESGPQSGSAYLFDRTSGVLLTELVPTDGGTQDQFGYSVAIQDGVVAVGAVGSDSIFSNTGAVYLFDAATGQQLAKLIPESNQLHAVEFGNSLSMSNGVLAIGAHFSGAGGGNRGSVFLFDSDMNSPSFGSEQIWLMPADSVGGDEFGHSVSIDGGILAASSLGDDDNGTDSGSVYLYDADPDSPSFGTEIAKLIADDGMADDGFGQSVSVNGGLIAVGANKNPSPSDAVFTGAVYTFGGDPLLPNFGTQVFKITPEPSTLVAWFGYSISLNNGLLAVGSHLGGVNGFASGSAYLMDASTGEQLGEYLPSDGDAFGQFGFSIALDEEGVFVVGSIGGLSTDSGAGSAYMFGIPELVCTADLTGDGSLNFFDVSAFLTFFQIEDAIADFTGDGEFNFFDVSAFLNAFAAGCP
ncbi:hypothetical protein COB72_10480 [bacterium]|nr:MAG: hypothetical protein COB72_10480 [bacterium]